LDVFGLKVDAEAATGATALFVGMQNLSRRRAEIDPGRAGFGAKKKKEEFPGVMGNMLPGNSFPQICVVSVVHSGESGFFAQGYGSSVD
jgi:hypothetical protein